MSKPSKIYLCSECGWSGSQWYGRCPSCGQWGTISEFHEAKLPTASSARSRGRGSRSATASNGRVAGSTVTIPSDPGISAEPITSGKIEDDGKRLSTGFSEFDRVLGGGIVTGSVTLVAGEPGIGKSTLLLESAGTIARTGRTVLYISGEESMGQIRLRARRIGAMDPHLLLATTTDLGTALSLIEHNKPALAVVDSVQTITSDDIDGISGGSAQVREVARGVIDVAKALNIPIMLVGHVTKDGTIAGPRTLEHLVDVVCNFEGDSRTALRMLRTTKNRFGPTDEVGCFDMVDEGIEQVTDPSGLFISSDDAPTEGTCITFTMDGHRSMPIEIQALVTASALPAPRRATNGVDYNRIAMLVAVLFKHAHVRVLDKDLYISTIAGAQAREPSCDLAACIAIASAANDVPVPRTTGALGEVSLIGEIRAVPRLEQRLEEAMRMGFTTMLIPQHQRIRNPDRFASMKLIRVPTLRTALARLHIISGRPAPRFSAENQSFRPHAQ
jgi:DNA repair protein RadA/Sms